ncbi:MAG: N-acetylmuramoyl-L-alanine amidase [Xenococcaceae cyanobacterium]
MRFHWLVLSFLSVFLFCSPAEAGRLLFWRFESNQNRLVFSTDEGVQPRAQLISNPTRLVIDLPGTTLGRPTVNQPIGGTIRSVRVGQFNSYTTRLVVELAPGYTMDPQQVKFRGISPTQWTVNLPTPQRIAMPPRRQLPRTGRQLPRTGRQLPPPNPPRNTPPSNPTPPVTSRRETESRNFQVTRNGLFVRLDSRGQTKIKVKRSRDLRRIDFDLEGVTLPASLASQTLPVNRYGVSEIQFSQTSTSPPAARVTLNVTEDSPDWQASLSRFGGLVLFPKGGIRAVDTGSSPQPPSTPSNPSTLRSLPSANRKANIESIELTNNNTQLLIRANQRVSARSSWNRNTRVYEIRIPNAQLAESIRGPQLERNSPISELRIREQDDLQTVVILVQPAVGVEIERLNQPSNNLLALQLRQLTAIDIFVPPPERRSSPPPTRSLPPLRTSSENPLPRVPNGRILVVIDPGHGGKDPGTIGIGGVQEKHIVLPISQQVKSYLEQQGVRVMMTRSSDYFVSLAGRTQMANRARAHLFVSIHANAINLSRPDVNGLETYYYQSQRLAQTIHNSILRSINIRDRRVRRARFYVLRTSSMPSVLVEVGFLTGREDAAQLKNPAHRRQMAEAIARGILEYIRQYVL